MSLAMLELPRILSEVDARDASVFLLNNYDETVVSGACALTSEVMEGPRVWSHEATPTFTNLFCTRLKSLDGGPSFGSVGGDRKEEEVSVEASILYGRRA